MTSPPASAPAPAVGASASAPAANRGRTLTHILTVFGGNVMAMVLGFAANIWAMRGLGPDQYGILSVALVVLYVIWQFTGKGLDQTAVCLGAAHGAIADPTHIFGSVYSLKLIANGVLLLIAAALASPLSGLFIGAGSGHWPLILAFAGAAAASLWGFTSAAIQAEARFGAYALVQVASGALRLGAMALVAAIGAFGVGTLMLATTAGFLGAALLGAVLAPAYARRPRWDTTALRPIIQSARWMLISSVLYLVYSRLDVLMLSRMVGGKPVGVYAAALAMIQILDMLAASTVTVFLPRFSRHTDALALGQQVRAALRSSLTLAIPLAAGYFLIEPGTAVLIRLVGPGYAGIEPLLKIMFFGALFTMITHPLHVIFYARRRPEILTALDAIMLVLIAAGNYIGIRIAGPEGAAAVVLLSRVLLGGLLLLGVVLELREARSAAHG